MFEQIPLLNDLPAPIQSIIGRLVLLIIALLLILLLRAALSWIVLRPMRRVVQRTASERDDLLTEAVLPAIRMIMLALTIYVTALILGFTSTFIFHLTRSLVIVGLIILCYRVVDILAPTSARLFRLTGLQIEDRLLPFIRTGVKLVVVAIGVVIIVQEWGYDVSGLVAGIGLGGLALSLAAQDSLANLFGFVAIVGDRPFDVGEYIVTPDVEGVVERVGVRSTRVRRLDQALISVPNNKLANSAILNWSNVPKRRLDTILTIHYEATSDDIRRLLTRIRDLLDQNPQVERGSIIVYFIEFGESSLNLLVRCYLLITDWGLFTAEKERIYLDIMDIVTELGLSIAFPSRSVYFENFPPIFDRDQASMPSAPPPAPAPPTAFAAPPPDAPEDSSNRPQLGSETDLPDKK